MPVYGSIVSVRVDVFGVRFITASPRQFCLTVRVQTDAFVLSAQPQAFRHASLKKKKKSNNEK